MEAFEIKKVGQIPTSLRKIYLDSLAESQEFFVESLVNNGACFLICTQEDEIGYAIVLDGCIVEFFLKKQATCLLPNLLDTFLRRSKSSSALVKSFDSLMISVCTSRPSKVEKTGYLFREFVDESFQVRSDVSFREGKESDISKILEMHDDFFHNEKEIKSYLDDSGLLLYFKDNKLQGVGIMKRIVSDRSAFDIGMVVSPHSRRSGLGSYIVSHIKSLCVSKGYVPVCGCETNNLASKRALEKAGFVATHGLLKFTYQLDS